MDDSIELVAPRSTADAVFDRLYNEIVTLKLLPGSKMSEAEVGRRLGVSRQPVRDAFKRLGNLDLLEIRPQRATVVRRFSMDEIANTRFLRLAVELEVIEQACAIWDDSKTHALEANLAKQEQVLNAGETDHFHQLDYGFHKLICALAAHPKAFETINQCKRKLDRLCVLSLFEDHAAPHVLHDHYQIAAALSARDVAQARDLTRHHVGRLDATIAEIHKTHAEYFQ